MDFPENAIFKEIKLPESIEEKRKLLPQYNGRFALIKDGEDKDFYRLIKLNYSGDPQVYHTLRQKTVNQKNLYIHDLVRLLVQTN